jgi:hypothetical protein
MAESIKIINGELEITKSQDIIISTMTKNEILDKRAELQTKVDHLKIDLTTTQAEILKWDTFLNELNKE